ncbi:MAG TPA: FAD-dependent oxidoreductase, partial [Caulobacteraceae bacterium]|nr:FAD-dependent oxidoreductase [Caulobacteraceae bacterium]
RLGGAVVGLDGGQARLADGGRIACDALVVATGAAPALAGPVPELRALTPIKGQILRLPGIVAEGPVLRLRKGYVCPDPAGAIVGASMEAGRSDRTIDPGVVAALLANAAQALPALAGAAHEAAVGVRAGAADGLPLAGASRTEGVWLAAGARRNGWLLAPVIAETLVAALAGRDGPASAALDPARLSLAAER